MSIAVVDLFDATGANEHLLPAGQVAGYVTGSGSVPWSADQLTKHPGVVRIAQSPFENVDAASHADVLDLENGAATLADAAPWAKGALNDFHNATRPGQRSPVIYCSRSSVTAVVNALIAGGVTSGIGLGVADWNHDRTQAANEVANASGPFPVVWRQYSDKGGNGAFDLGVVSVPWLTTVSGKTPPPPPPKIAVPPGQWNNPNAWSWHQVIVAGIGLNGAFFAFSYNPVKNEWARVL